MATVLMPLPATDFDPTESGVPWLELTRRGHVVHIATPAGEVAAADGRMLDGHGLGPWKPLLRADAYGRAAYAAMATHTSFTAPLTYRQAAGMSFGALLLPGGHAPGMREYLESATVQRLVVEAFARQAPVAAICHGVLVAARARGSDGRSVLHGRNTTALTAVQELTAWAITPWLGTYYRTYPITVQAEVTAALAAPEHFVAGPPPLRRDAPGALDRGFVVRDGNYLSARWPGDAHRFAATLAGMLEARAGTGSA